MDQYTPTDPEQQTIVRPPGTPEPPAHQPYQPPVQQQPQPGSYPPAGPTPQPPGYPPPQQPGQYYAPPSEQKKKGFNWLACCGFSCLALLIITVILVALSAKSCMGFVNQFQAFEQVATEVANADPGQVRVESTIVDSRVLAQNPESYTGQWIAVEGKQSSGVDAGSTYDMGQYGAQESTSYVLEGQVVVMDMSRAAKVGQGDDILRAYGKVIVYDMSSMPIVGKLLEEAAKQDPNMQDVPVKMVLFYAREVEVVEQPVGEEEAGEGAAPPWEQRQW